MKAKKKTDKSQTANPKSQITNKYQITKSKVSNKTTPEPNALLVLVWNLNFCNLFVFWSLGFGT
jgi:hypothetical protein